MNKIKTNVVLGKILIVSVLLLFCVFTVTARGINSQQISSDTPSSFRGGTFTPSSNEDTNPLRKGSSGGGCVTILGTDGKKMDLINPINNKIILGKYCVAFDPVTMRRVEEKQWSPLEFDKRLLNIRWSNKKIKLIETSKELIAWESALYYEKKEGGYGT